MTIASNKALLRKQYLCARDALSPEARAAADAQILSTLMALRCLREAHTVFCYVSVGTETDTLGVLEALFAAEKRVAVPRVRVRGTGLMDAVQLSECCELVAGSLGIPTAPAANPVIAPADIDLALLPALAVDGSGYRLGYGGGYYDRFLAPCPATRVVLCNERFLVRQLPREPHDLAASLVVANGLLRMPAVEHQGSAGFIETFKEQ